jgi:hypothetical protein
MLTIKNLPAAPKFEDTTRARYNSTTIFKTNLEFQNSQKEV